MARSETPRPLPVRDEYWHCYRCGGLHYYTTTGCPLRRAPVLVSLEVRDGE